MVTSAVREIDGKVEDCEEQGRFYRKGCPEGLSSSREVTFEVRPK